MKKSEADEAGKWAYLKLEDMINIKKLGKTNLLFYFILFYFIVAIIELMVHNYWIIHILKLKTRKEN